MLTNIFIYVIIIKVKRRKIMTNKELEKELKELKALVEKHIKLESPRTVNIKNWNEYDWDELDNIVRSGENLNFKIDNEQVTAIPQTLQ